MYHHISCHGDFAFLYLAMLDTRSPLVPWADVRALAAVRPAKTA